MKLQTNRHAARCLFKSAHITSLSVCNAPVNIARSEPRGDPVRLLRTTVAFFPSVLLRNARHASSWDLKSGQTVWVWAIPGSIPKTYQATLIDGSIVAEPCVNGSEGSHEQRRWKMLWTIIVILGILWLLGFSFHVGGGLIHLLLVVAVVVLVFNLLSGRRAV